MIAPGRESGLIRTAACALPTALSLSRKENPAMSISCEKSNSKRMAIVLASAALVLALSSTLRAQRGDVPQQMPQQRNPDMQIRALESETETARNNRDPQLVLAEVNEDFGRLRAIDDDFKLAIKAADAPDYKRIEDSSAELKKRATRLKADLVFPAPARDEN